MNDNYTQMAATIQCDEEEAWEGFTHATWKAAFGPHGTFKRHGIGMC